MYPREEQVYSQATHFCHLFCNVNIFCCRCKESIEQKKKSINLYKAKCSAVEQDTKDILEYLEYDVVKKLERLEEVQKLYETEKETITQEPETKDLKHAERLKLLQEELQELKSSQTRRGTTLTEREVTS